MLSTFSKSNPFELGGIIIGHVETVPKLSISVYTRGRYTAHLPPSTTHSHYLSLTAVLSYGADTCASLDADPTQKMFGDLKSAAGVKALNEFLADNSYIEG